MILVIVNTVRELRNEISEHRLSVLRILVSVLETLMSSDAPVEARALIILNWCSKHDSIKRNVESLRLLHQAKR